MSFLRIVSLLHFTRMLFSSGKSSPNIIIILWMIWVFGYRLYGGEIETPNLDALARGEFVTPISIMPPVAVQPGHLYDRLHPHVTGIGHMTNPPGTRKHDYGEDFPNYRGFRIGNVSL